MTTIPPTRQLPNPPNTTMLLKALARQIKKEINCVKVGEVQAYDPGNATQAPTVTVKIAQQQVTSVAVDGSKTFAEYPLLLKVPVYFMGGGGVTLTFPIAEGDECIILFNDRAIDNWLNSGPGLPPSVPRLHDLSDGIALVGIHSNPRAIEGISTTAAQLRADDGSSFIEVSAAGAVRVHAGAVYEWDVNGYGQKITHTGGSNYTIDNYTTGAIITTNTHPISPPGPP